MSSFNNGINKINQSNIYSTQSWNNSINIFVYDDK